MAAATTEISGSIYTLTRIEYSTVASNTTLWPAHGTLPAIGITLLLPPNGGVPTLAPAVAPAASAAAAAAPTSLPILVQAQGQTPVTPLNVSGFMLGFIAPNVLFRLASPLASSSSPPGESSDSTPRPSATAVSNSPFSSGSATPTNSSTQKSSGISSGATAGIAIGCLIAGALIAGLVLWFCWRKRKAPGIRDHEASRMALMPAHEKGFATKTVPLGNGSSATSPVSAALPLPMEDKAITGEISKIANLIKNHVQSYYQNGRVSPGLVDVDDIHALGTGQPISAGTLSTLLGNTATREIALRFCIAWAVCSRMRPGADPKTSLLPQEVAGCVQSINPQSGASSAQNSSALARWRVMTAELSQASYVREPFTNADSRNASIQTTLAALENILQPFADSRMDNGERKRNLEEILKRSALFAFTLFSQPSTWDFDWREKQGVKSDDLCIFPALVQLSDENGQAVNPPRPFSEAVVRRLSE